VQLKFLYARIHPCRWGGVSPLEIVLFGTSRSLWILRSYIACGGSIYSLEKKSLALYYETDLSHTSKGAFRKLGLPSPSQPATTALPIRFARSTPFLSLSLFADVISIAQGFRRYRKPCVVLKVSMHRVCGEALWRPYVSWTSGHTIVPNPSPAQTNLTPFDSSYPVKLTRIDPNACQDLLLTDQEPVTATCQEPAQTNYCDTGSDSKAMPHVLGRWIMRHCVVDGLQMSFTTSPLFQEH
jgi:hypothetical protein